MPPRCAARYATHSLLAAAMRCLCSAPAKTDLQANGAQPHPPSSLNLGGVLVTLVHVVHLLLVIVMEFLVVLVALHLLRVLLHRRAMLVMLGLMHFVALVLTNGFFLLGILEVASLDIGIFTPLGGVAFCTEAITRALTIISTKTINIGITVQAASI